MVKRGRKPKQTKNTTVKNVKVKKANTRMKDGDIKQVYYPFLIGIFVGIVLSIIFCLLNNSLKIVSINTATKSEIQTQLTRDVETTRPSGMIEGGPVVVENSIIPTAEK